MFFKELVHVYKTHEKRNTRFPLLLFLCTEQYLHKPVYIFARQGSSLLLNLQHVHVLFIITFFSLSVPHILYFDAAKFSIKLFSLIYFTVSVVRQRNEYEIVNATQPIQIITSPEDVNLHKNPDNRAVGILNQIHIR